MPWRPPGAYAASDWAPAKHGRAERVSGFCKIADDPSIKATAPKAGAQEAASGQPEAHRTAVQHAALIQDPRESSIPPNERPSLFINRREPTSYRRVGRKTSRVQVNQPARPRHAKPPVPPASVAGEAATASTAQTTIKSAAPSVPVKRFHEAFGDDALGDLTDRARQDLLGTRLPSVLLPLFQSLADDRNAIRLANALRNAFSLPELPLQPGHTTRRQIALTREACYVAAVAALSLPLAVDDASKDDVDAIRPRVSLTEFNAPNLVHKMRHIFTTDRIEYKDGEPGEVVWLAGVGRMKTAGAGTGYRPCHVSGQRGLHVFLDYSNILYGLIADLQRMDGTSLPPKHQRVLSLPLLSLLLTRSRPTSRGALHAVMSSPLRQDLDPLVRLGWEVSVLKRVELLDVEVGDPDAEDLVQRAHHGQNGTGIRRFKEQAVDEMLQLKMLTTLNAVAAANPDTAEPGTIVLATGDARPGQFSSEGFVGAVRSAIRASWTVELWSFRAGLSRAWAETAKRENWGRHFRIHLFDPYGELLVEVGDDS